MDSTRTNNTVEPNQNSTLASNGRDGSLGVGDLFRLHAKNRVAADPAGWSFAAMEWWTTWLLLQRDGRVWKQDLSALYDGTLFWTIREERAKNGNLAQGYGWHDWLRGLWNNGTWKTWEAEHKDTVEIEVETEL